MADDLSATLACLHKELAEALLKRVKAGDASPADLNVARQMLKDNGIDAVPKKGSPLANLAADLPSFPEDANSFTGKH